MGSMYQWVSLETRTAVAASLGYNLLYLLSLFVTIVLFWCCVFAARAVHVVCILLPRPHRFAVTGLVHCVHAILWTFVSVPCSVLYRATSLRFSTRRKQSAASGRRSQHDEVKQPSQEATTAVWRCGVLLRGASWSDFLGQRFRNPLLSLDVG